MWVTYNNEKDGRTYRMDLSVVPFPHISKENFISLQEMFEPQEVGEIIVSLTDYIYNNKEHTLKNKCQISFFNRILKDMVRESFGYFKKARNLNNFKNHFIDITEGVETTQNEAIEEKEYKDTTSTSNASNYPIGYSENQEYEDEVNVAESNPIEIDDEEERNVVKYNDFVIAGDNVENDFRQLLIENVDLLGCMSYDGLTKYKVAYDFLVNTEINRERVNTILREERKRRMENKLAN